MDALKRKAGFTLVEVIVVSVIVAILALLAVLLYFGFVNDARKNITENEAASAASFLNTAVNVGVPVPGPSIANPLDETGIWTVTTPSGGVSTFRCPVGVTLQINETDKTVSATLKGITSSSYGYSK